MNTTALARELGKAIQADERYLAFVRAKEANEKDTALTELMTKIEEVRGRYLDEAQSEDPDQAVMDACDTEFRQLYDEIVLNETMKNYEFAKQELDDMMNYIIGILNLCVNGYDPETCEPDLSAGCSGNCGSCGGCG